jgi:hypothetical protein
MTPTTLPDGVTAGAHFLRIDVGFMKGLESKLGNDPDLTERRWFLEHTRDLRERLFARRARPEERQAN